MTNDTKISPMIDFNAIKKNLQGLKVPKLVVSPLQNSLDTYPTKTTTMINCRHNDQFLSSVESKAGLSVKRVKTT